MDLDNGVQKLFFIKWMITEKPQTVGNIFLKKGAKIMVIPKSRDTSSFLSLISAS